jgi:hypothetical protein
LIVQLHTYIIVKVYLVNYTLAHLTYCLDMPHKYLMGKRVQITTTLDDELLLKLRHLAVDEKTTLNDLIEQAVMRHWFKDTTPKIRITRKQKKKE